jgi:crotonobetainyl-CoA:carnitine CoA-transferase CaiB-like acyl-CoA transferase
MAPLLGEHNAEVLTQLGYTPDAIAAMEAAGVLRRGDT